MHNHHYPPILLGRPPVDAKGSTVTAHLRGRSDRCVAGAFHHLRRAALRGVRLRPWRSA